MRPTFEMELVAKAEHIDELGHVNNAVWVQWIQHIAVAHWHAIADPAHDQAYFLFLYNPIALYAVNKAVEFVPHEPTLLGLTEVSVTEQHWSVRKQGAAVQE